MKKCLLSLLLLLSLGIASKAAGTPLREGGTFYREPARRDFFAVTIRLVNSADSTEMTTSGEVVSSNGIVATTVGQIAFQYVLAKLYVVVPATGRDVTQNTSVSLAQTWGANGVNPNDQIDVYCVVLLYE